ncbi:MAG: FAD-linked oxidase C-terminal domain-containing protein [Thermoanaerobaculia bacterium]|jgi:FAD/FMN-containing dehydrogenase/Fe-S oxidoreductase
MAWQDDYARRIREPYRGDAERLARELRAAIEGDVLFDAGSRALYATDSSNYRQVPIGVVRPKSTADVIAALEVARRHGAPILGRGAGTSLAGQSCNVAVVLDFSRHMNRILEVNAGERFARVEPGVVLDNLRDAAEVHKLTFGPDPATHSRCTLGGMIGNNSCGVHSIMAGKTDANVEELEIVTYDGVRMRVGATGEAELDAIVRGGGRRGEIYEKLRSIRDRYAPLIREKFPKIPRAVSGYNLPYLLPENGFHVARALVGTESTCVVVLEAKTRLVHSPPVRNLVVLGFSDVYAAADRVPEVLEFGCIGLEGFDDRLVSDVRTRGLDPESIAMLPAGAGWLLVEFGGETLAEANEKGEGMIAAMRASRGEVPSILLLDDPKRAARIWKVRESALGSTAVVEGRGHAYEGWEDAAVPPARLGDYLRDLRRLLDRYGYIGDFYGHFGDGCVHTRNDFDLQSKEGIAKFRAYMHEAAALVAGYGGSFSGEHGDGQSRAELLPIMFGDELMGAFREFKEAWDPEWRMNPGKVIEPYRLDENLRLGEHYEEKRPATRFAFAKDDGSFDHAISRCVGVGLCRRESGGTMCPSWMVTREEKHSTRGRARLLFEMLEGDVVKDGWKSAEVKEALNLCLACKGCKSDCPTQVDMATYKAEFLSHYYEGRRRPLAAYTMGWIHIWARIGSMVPRLANFMMEWPISAGIMKKLAGIDSRRAMPKFADTTFREGDRNRSALPASQCGAGTPACASPKATASLRENVDESGASRRAQAGVPAPHASLRVIFWPDTFNNHFTPSVAHAAVEVLERAGFDVVLPPAGLCCGRPLYDWGFLDMARRQLLQIIEALGDEIRAGTPIVGIEPSCVAVFRDELPNLIPGDAAARLSSQVFTLAEFLERENVDLPTGEAKILFHGHCHQKAVMKTDAEMRVLARMGARVETPDSGCCGMAGAFGFEAKNYDVSSAVGERVLLPAVRAASDDTVIVTDGFSCREQVSQLTERTPKHFAELVCVAMRNADRETRNAERETEV